MRRVIREELKRAVSSSLSRQPQRELDRPVRPLRIRDGPHCPGADLPAGHPNRGRFIA